MNATLQHTNRGSVESRLQREPLPTGDALREYWLNNLPQGERAVLESIIESHPTSVTRDHIAFTTGYKQSTRNAYIQRLQTRKLIVVRSGEIAAHSQLFK